MKKIAILMFLGSFMLVAAVLSRTYAYPRLAVVPFNLNSKVIAENPPGEPATYFSIAELAETSSQLGNQTKARVNLKLTENVSDELGNDDVVVVETYACTDVIATDCSTERYPLSAALSTFAIDRSTGEPVAWSGASVETGGEVETGVEFKGLTIKFPFNAQKETYRFWNGELCDSVPVEYVGETDVDGLRAYQYRGQIEPTVLGQLDIPGSIIGSDETTVTVDRVSSSETTYTVEPESGVIISATSIQDSYAELDGERVLTITDGTFTTPKATADDAVKTYKPLSKALFAVRVVVPVVGLVSGLLMLSVGSFLALRRRANDRATRVKVPDAAHV